MSMNPRETTDKIRIDYQNYISSILTVRDNEITRLANDAVKKASFVKGPYLETTMPFVEGKSLKALAEEGLVSTEFGSMGKSVHYDDWKLRIHQEHALRHIITDQRNMVVSTGTGSGKTECYLYPIFNSLMREKENGTLNAGVRALLIFPMNALANDQQKKLRKLLREYPDITFGRYTGETPHSGKKETPEQAEVRLHQEYDTTHMTDTDEAYRTSIPNEMMCREMMAKKPPHILLTNYAMLEYMLLRPDTAPFFDNSSAENWQFIVIDEAHTYKGANGTEIAYLLRRLKERIRHHMDKPFRCIATSATLGSEDGKKGLAQFAENLFSEPFNETDVITTKRINREIPSSAITFMPEDYIRLKDSVKDMSEFEKGTYLYEKLLTDLRLFRVYDALKTKPKQIEEVSSIVFDDIANEKDRESALINLIELAAAAKKSENEAALLPARYHLFIKSLEGMFTQLYPKKAVFLDRKEKIYAGNNSFSVFELANCQKCGQEYLVGKIVQGNNADFFVQTSNIEKPEYLFVSEENEIELNDFDEDDAFEESEKIKELQKYHLCLCCGKITDFSEHHSINCCNNSDPKKIVVVYNLKYAGKDGESNCCPCCGATKKGLIKRFLTANQPATFAIAKSLYDAIPPRPLIAKKEDDIFGDDIFEDDIFEDDIFEDESNRKSSDITLTSSLDDERGRKLLIFSDNRQEAAFFAGFFEKKYNLVMWRKVILQCLKEVEGNKLCVSDLIGRVMNTADKSGLYSFDQERLTEMTDDQKRELAALYIMQEFINPDIDTGIERMGYIQIEPERLKISDNIEIAGIKGNDLWNVLRYMMDTLRQKGAVSFPENIRATNDFFAPRNHAGYFRHSQSTVQKGGYIYGFLPKDGAKNKRLALMLKLIQNEQVSPEEKDSIARKDLSKIYELLSKLKGRGYIVETIDSAKGTVYQLNYAKWNFRLLKQGDKLFRCSKCGKVFGYSIKDICPEMKCSGSLEIVDASDIRKEPYSDNLFSDKKLIPMVAREHTAQLSAKTARDYQTNFEEGKINVLSCSTTFEMGVDVGELEATFLRNVPPETSNYIQRAGRAGRRTSSAAFSVTFSRRTSHDMTFFNDPAQIIAGKINPPVLEIDNDKIAERHLNSIIISWFFKIHPDYFTEDTKKIVSYQDETNMALELKKELEKHPADLLDSIHNVLPDDICKALKIDDWGFINDIAGEEGSLSRAIYERFTDIDGLKKYCSEVTSNQENANGKLTKGYGRAMAAEKLITTLEEEPSINFLSSHGVLPKYGFPIDTVSLDILGGSDQEAKKIDLSRDLKMAISEFAPPAKIVANGKIWESYAINTIPDKGWPAYIYHVCPTCKKIYHPEGSMVDVTTDLNSEPAKRCDFCDTLLNPKKFIIPLFGFSTQMEYKPKPVGEAKPNTYYATQTQFWGIDSLTEKQKAEAKERTVLIKGKNAKITYSPGGKLFVLNQGINGRGLNVCPSCGFTKDPLTPLRANKHETKYKKICGCRNLINVSLGHEFSTDIMKIDLPSHMVQVNLGLGSQPKNQYLSILYAILEGASKALDINRDDINGCVTENQELVLYDDTAGGSGYVKHIYNNFEKVLREARNKVSGMCGCTEETSCYGCLRNYSNQHFHDDISRGLAWKYLDWMIDGECDQTDSKAEQTIHTIEPVSPVFEEMIGAKELQYVVPDSSVRQDTLTQLEALKTSSDTDEVIDAIGRIISAVGDSECENPIVDSKLPARERDIWPEIFWPESRVALFMPEMERQFKILKKYNWYCYLIDEDLNAEIVVRHIKKGD